MKKEIQEKFYSEYPELFRDHKKGPEESCMYWGISIGNGWETLLNEVCIAIVDHVNDTGMPMPKFCQIKEKFGGLRLYMEGADDVINEIIEAASSKSYEICEVTGKHGTLLHDLDWHRVLCDEEYQKSIKKAEDTKKY